MSLSLRLGIGLNAHKGSLLNQVDVHAQAYIDAEGITDETAISAINTLVKDLKAINAIETNFVNFDTPANSKRKAIYPFPGTVAASNKRNLINPADTDEAFRLVFSAAPTINNLGVNFGGTKYANTKILADSLDINDVEIDLVHTSNGTTSSVSTEIGVYNAAGSLILMSHTDSNFQAYAGSSLIYTTPGISGFFTQTQRTGTAIGNHTLNKDKNKIANTGIIGGTLPNMEIYIGRLNGIARYSNRTFGFVGIGKAMSDTVNNLYYAAIEKYNNTLGRVPKNNIVFEGHSFLAVTNIVMPYIAPVLDTANFRTIGYKNMAVSSSLISDMVSRVSTFDTYKKEGISDLKNIAIIWIGANESNPDGDANYAALASYLITQSAKGWHFIVCTMTPITTSILPAWRNTYNDHIRANTANIPNYHIFNTDDYAELSDPTNTTYFNADKLHLNTTGGAIAGAAIGQILLTI